VEDKLRQLSESGLVGWTPKDFATWLEQKASSIRVAKATAAQAQVGTEVVKPSFAEIMQLAQDFFVFRGNSHGDSFFATDITAKTDPAQALEAFVRAGLSRWGRTAIEPVPVAERLPEAGDCDAKGRCWWWHPETFGRVACWCYSRGNGTERLWLPCNDLPNPTRQED
jgi:hypothetical protein